MKRIIIGTAGHIDHGKTALVRAITGIDTDRLKEEKKRGISIELGFAPLTLSSGQLAGIVDVPGHERFVRQMLAGAFGMDLVLLIIASDEGIMPQTREHLDIIQLLGIKKGIVVLTKKDLVDEEWLMMVEDDIKEYLRDTDLKDWPIIPVSSITGESIPELLHLIEMISAEVQEKPAVGQTRLPIDRVFTMTGFGTVVTGTLWSGKIRVNDVLEVLPSGLTAKVRTLNVHNRKVEEALAGQRVAVNLQGVEVSEVHRGNTLASPGYLQPTYRISASMKLLTSSRPLKNWARIRFHLGTDETLGRVVLLEHDELQPGTQGYVQIVMEEPLVCAKGDRFVIRFYSPVTTIGGGVIIDPHPPRQKRFNEAVLQEIAVKEEGDLEEVILQEMNKRPDRIMGIDELAVLSHGSPDELREILDRLREQELVYYLNREARDLAISRTGLDQNAASIARILEDHRKRFPLRKGMLREELRSKHFKNYPVKVFNFLLNFLEAEGLVALDPTHIRLPGASPALDNDTLNAIKLFRDALNRTPLAPPGLKEIQEEVKGIKHEFSELAAYLEETGEIIKVAENVYFSRSGLETAWDMIDKYFEESKELTLAQARDIWGTSRKHTLPLLEYFDRMKYTKRIGDNRVKMAK